jgi:hypothetical protein
MPRTYIEHRCLWCWYRTTSQMAVNECDGEGAIRASHRGCHAKSGSTGHLKLRLSPSFATSPSSDINTTSPNSATCLTCKSRNTTLKRQSIQSQDVSRRWYHALRHRLRPRHPRSRPRLRIRTVRFLSLAQPDRRPSLCHPSPCLALYTSLRDAAFAVPRRVAAFLPSQPRRVHAFGRHHSSHFPPEPIVELPLTSSKLR